jgi:hypothetical protein
MTAKFRQRIDTTYADLRPSDLVIDKSGQAWPIDDMVSIPGDSVNFWLLDPVTGVRMHFMTRLAEQSVKVSRLPTQADEASKLEAGFDAVEAVVNGDNFESMAAALRETVTMEESVAAVEENVYANAVVSLAEAVAAVEEIGGTVEAEVTAAEVDAAGAATDDAPLTISPFADMTPLEARSHLYLLHGVYGHDLQGKAELAALHDQAHAATAAGTLNSRHVPHSHEVK